MLKALHPSWHLNLLTAPDLMMLTGSVARSIGGFASGTMGRTNLPLIARHINDSVARKPGIRALATRGGKSPLQIAFKNDDDDDDVRYRTQKNPEIPNLGNLPKRWLRMDAGQQDDVIAYLEDRMRGDWRDLTTAERKAAHFVWFGAWGPRSKSDTDTGSLYSYFAGFMAVSLAGVVSYKLYEKISTRAQPSTSE